MSPLSAERRKHRRHPLSGSVQCVQPSTQKHFPARCIDASHGGALMYLPVSTPVAAGQSIHIQFGPIQRDDLTDLADKTLPGRIVRVSRQAMLEKGYITVGVQFESD